MFKYISVLNCFFLNFALQRRNIWQGHFPLQRKHIRIKFQFLDISVFGKGGIFTWNAKMQKCKIFYFEDVCVYQGRNVWQTPELPNVECWKKHWYRPFVPHQWSNYLFLPFGHSLTRIYLRFLMTFQIKKHHNSVKLRSQFWKQIFACKTCENVIFWQNSAITFKWSFWYI